MSIFMVSVSHLLDFMLPHVLANSTVLPTINYFKPFLTKQTNCLLLCYSEGGILKANPSDGGRIILAVVEKVPNKDVERWDDCFQT